MNNTILWLNFHFPFAKKFAANVAGACQLFIERSKHRKISDRKLVRLKQRRSFLFSEMFIGICLVKLSHMKSKQFGSGNLLRDLFQQSQLHGVEFRNLVCKHFGWSADQFKQQTTGSRLFTRNDASSILSVKFDAIGSQLKYAKKCMESVYISSEK